MAGAEPGTSGLIRGEEAFSGSAESGGGGLESIKVVGVDQPGVSGVSEGGSHG